MTLLFFLLLCTITTVLGQGPPQGPPAGGPPAGGPPAGGPPPPQPSQGAPTGPLPVPAMCDQQCSAITQGLQPCVSSLTPIPPNISQSDVDTRARDAASCMCPVLTGGSFDSCVGCLQQSPMGSAPGFSNVIVIITNVRTFCQQGNTDGAATLLWGLVNPTAPQPSFAGASPTSSSIDQTGPTSSAAFPFSPAPGPTQARRRIRVRA
ncbi:hypothetical protein HDV00_008584 [Rhizophlyctis rosea]|nr:hypothetical protein HDV00_008584 [Rhizophlyctis rosea]